MALSSTGQSLKKNEVHVWRAALNLPQPDIELLRQTLSKDEQARADRFTFPHGRADYTAARGMLRAILGNYLEIEPARLRFSYGPRGKPALDPAFHGHVLQFNVSHSHGVALFALTRHRRIGVDVERIRPDFACEEIAGRFFSSQEVAKLRALPDAVRTAAFFDCWTRKEAFIKAKGDGLSFPLDAFDVAFAPGEPAAILRTEWDPEEASRWCVWGLDAGPDYTAALAVQGRNLQLRRLNWAESNPYS